MTNLILTIWDDDLDPKTFKVKISLPFIKMHINVKLRGGKGLPYYCGQFKVLRDTTLAYKTLTFDPLTCMDLIDMVKVKVCDKQTINNMYLDILITRVHYKIENCSITF